MVNMRAIETRNPMAMAVEMRGAGCGEEGVRRSRELS